MTYFSLRKHDPEPVDEDLDEAIEELEEAAPAGESPDTWTGAVRAGLLGPGAWLAARFGITTAWVVHVVAVWAVGYYGGWVAVGVALVWLLAVGLFIPREFLDRLAAAVEGRHTARPEAAPETTEEPSGDPIVTVLWRLIADAPGVHLKTLAEHLQAAAPDQAVDRAQVRAKLAALQIPVRPSVRDAAGRVNEGVHRADLTAWQQALPQGGPGTPSGARSGPVATALTCDVGDAPTGVATPLSRLRGLLPRGGA